MFTTIDVWVHPDDTTVEPNETNTGIVIHETTSHDPRLNLFLGHTAHEVAASLDMISKAGRELLERLR
jgi:hypothetical protein